MIYTSYFKNLKNMDLDNKILINISRYPVLSISTHFDWDGVKPSKSLLLAYKNGICSISRFKKQYLNELIIDEDVINCLKKYLDKGGMDVVLLCHEKSNEFCHRHILTDYLNDKFNLNISEYYIEKER